MSSKYGPQGLKGPQALIVNNIDLTPLPHSEVRLLDATWAEHGGMDQWQLVEWCHIHCGEWTPLARGCAPIAVERIAQALGKSPELVQKLAREAAELNRLDEIFAPA